MSSQPTAARFQGDGSQPIAIIGFSARLPQEGGSTAGFWKLLCEGRSAASAIPKERFNIDAFYHPDVDRIDTMHIKHVNFLDGDIAAFDAPFFSIQPSEVKSMDPQQRCILEASFRAFENAGIPMNTVVASKTCVFVGNSARDYEALLLRDPESPARYIGTGIGTSMLANRVSWFYDLRGPSVALDTACSSSLSALHLACQSLKDGESRMGLVGGCNLILAPDVSIVPLTNMGFFSPDGKCFSFDHRANGYAKGEGAGFIVIKRLVDAVEDGDTIRAVIRATGANQDGKTPGLTQPSQRAQEENIRETYRKAGLNMNDTQYFESHGTGTQVGDPIEAGAINAAFRRTQDNPIYVGAVKPNIGHLEAASSIAGLIKCVMVLENGVIPPNINFEKPNINIQAEEWHLKFPVKPTLFPTQGLRRASINSFGYGGSNTHAILDDAYHYMSSRGIKGNHNTLLFPPTQKSLDQLYNVPGSPPMDNANSINGYVANHPEQLKIVVFSAMDEDGLHRLAEAYQNHFSSSLQFRAYDACTYLGRLAYTLSERRSQLPWRSFVLADSIMQLRDGLDTMPKAVRASAGLTLGFIFTGQGAQWIGMGRGLLQHPTFQHSLSKSQTILQELGCVWKINDMFQSEEDNSIIDNPAVAQPLCTALQVALVDLLVSWHIFPTTVVGHSSGEIAAAYCAGSLSHESTMKVAYYRGFLAASLGEGATRQGGMVSVGVSESTLLPILAEVNSKADVGRIEIGCINSPENVTVTGDQRGIKIMSVLMQQKGIFERRLPVNVAYHSAFMSEIADEYLTLIEHIGPSRGLDTSVNAQRPTVFSTVTGSMVAAESLSRPAYWITNLVSKVQFSAAMEDMCRHLLNERTASSARKVFLIEVGPSSALQRPTKDTVDKLSGSEGISYDSVLKRNQPGMESCLGLIGRLWAHGYQADVLTINNPTSKENETQLLVDLPEYPFNHANSYWTESRISKNFRMRGHARHDLLGTTLADWNPLEPRWRNIIRVKENPWILDHVVQGSAVYPASGMFAMAIEGARQIAGKERAIDGYRVENVSFYRALVVNSAAEGVESQLHFRRHKANSIGSLEAINFTLYAHTNDEWALICDGAVTVEFWQSDTEEICIEDLGCQLPGRNRSLEADTAACKEAVNPKQLYRNLNSFGYEFGPTFQSLDGLRYNESGEATATVRLHDWKEKTNYIFPSDYVIHPTALDGIFHLTLVAISKGGWKSIPTFVPTQARSLWVSDELVKQVDMNDLRVFTKETFHGYRERDFSITARNLESKLMVKVEGWRMTALSNVDSNVLKQSALSCYHIEWKPDPVFMDGFQSARFCEQLVSDSGLLEATQIDRLELVCLLFMSMIIQADPPPKTSAPHLQKYLDWTRSRYSQAKFDHWLAKDVDGDLFRSESPCRDDLLSSVARRSAEGALHVSVGQNLTRVLSGEMDSLDLLFTTSLAPDFYHSSSLGISYRKVAAYIDLLAHKNPNLRVLEIGAGTGAATNSILETLDFASEGATDPRFNLYTYTDISPAFFKDAKEQFSSYTSRMKFAVLDIEQDPLKQGFEMGAYDVIVCGLVLHATANLSNTLRHVRRLIQPAGKLVLIEPTNPEAVRVSFAFGLLPGWWLGEEGNRKEGPLLSIADWDKVLLENGFSGAEIQLPDYDDDRQTFSAIISTALSVDEQPSQGQNVALVIDSIASENHDIAQKFRERLRSTAFAATTITSIEDLRSEDLRSSICVFLLEINAPFLLEMSQDDFAALKAMTGSAAGILWVTRGCAASAQKPEFSLATGFGRNMGSEDMGRRFVELALEADTSASQTVDLVSKVFDEAFHVESRHKETEYMQKDGFLCLSRVVKVPGLNHSINAKTQRQEVEMRRLDFDPDRPLELTIGSPGRLSTLHFKDDEGRSVPLASHEVEIKVMAVGLEHSDVQVALGQASGDALGSGCAGTIVAVGNTVHNFTTGDRVCCCTIKGSFRTYVRAQAIATLKIPNSMSYSAAAALPAAFSVAYYALNKGARLMERETVLIHGGAQAIAQAAIQIALCNRAEVFVIVGNEAEKQILIETYKLRAENVFCSARACSESALVRNNNGADVVVTFVGNEPSRIRLGIKPFGRFIALGYGDDLPYKTLSTQSVSLIPINLRSFLEQGQSFLKATMEALEKLLENNFIRAPKPLFVHRPSEIEGAFQEVQDEKNIGAHILELSENDTVPMLPSTRPAYYFSPDATYVIAGGLGGLGRSIVRWMVERRAKHFVLLSRSGAKGKAAIELIEELKSCRVYIATPSCDISDESKLSAILEQLKATMPPVKGCIQASMVLKDGVFDNMSLEDFNTAVRPKVQGSWNLHKFLPKDIDFYVLLSSITGITGSRGQRNYACGNTYQNALARHRVSQGQKCISLDLGSVLSIGFAAEKDLSASLEKDGFQGIRKNEFFALLEYCCDPSVPVLTPMTSQIVTGLGGMERMSAERLEEVYWTHKPLFSILRQQSLAKTVSSDEPVSTAVDYGHLIKTAASQEAAETVILEALKQRLAAGLSIPVEDIDVEKAIYNFGIDSLVALDIRNWFIKEIKADVTIFDIMQSRNVLALGKLTAEKSGHR